LPILIVKLDKGDRRIPFTTGQSLRDILDKTDIRVRSGCRGMGACGLCRVRLEEPKVCEPTTIEHTYLDHSQLAQGIRLACQVMPKQDLKIKILDLALKSNWKNLPAQKAWHEKPFPVCPPAQLPGDVTTPCGVAVDLGTTHISLSLHDFTTGLRLAGRYGLNPQVNYGSDVMTRLAAASESSEQAQDLSQQAIRAIGNALLDMAVREDINLRQVVRFTIVGNTAMLALLTTKNIELLIQPSQWMRPIDCIPEDVSVWSALWGIHPQAKIEVLPPLAGFVGSDLMAGVLATQLTETETGSLFIDFGTNSEMALWDGQTLWVTSAAGGPAFEGSGISCGLPAESGAIFQVNLEKGVTNVSVVAGGKALGICGSGIVDLISNLVRSGKLTEKGLFSHEVAKSGFVLVKSEQRIILTKGDVDIFQRAKAAVGTGIRILLATAGLHCKDLQRICIGGAFGHFLNITNAQDIGMLPQVAPYLIELCGNTALVGCQSILLSPAAVKKYESLKKQTSFINLVQHHDFEDLFLENLYLRPIQDDPAS
jgi:uncharacterized 2Fe-2S/4Fe-4S cluster protein (DUF4445 family)